ncbi:MAG: hypothetical protein B7Z75_09360 [Acidocella sp. 20-57-95]|nr:MAG: hypothetical protein B7Z75_09360 [Acidocella sp. 20-57-95]
MFAGVDSKTNNAWCNISHKTILDDAWRDKIIMSFQSTQQLLLADIICDLRRPTNKSVTRHTFIMDNMNVTLCRLNWKPLYAIERGIGLKFRVNDVQNVYDYLNPFYGLAFAAFWVPYKPAKDHFNPLAVFENYVAETIKDSAKTPATERMSLLAAYYSSNLVSQP